MRCGIRCFEIPTRLSADFLSLGSAGPQLVVNGNVDLGDYGDLKDCFLGPDGGRRRNCECFDFDGDDDVDLDDFAALQGLFTDWAHHIISWKPFGGPISDFPTS